MSTRDYLSLVKEMGAFTALLVQSRDIQTFLDRMVQMVANHLKSDVCSVYLYDVDDHELVLRATAGLNPQTVNHVRLKLGEGLVGSCLKEYRVIRVEKASQHPQYKYFPDTEEENFESFLAIPIHHGTERIGVIVVQRKEANYFQQEDVVALQAVGAQLSGVIENIKVLYDIGQSIETTEQSSNQAKSQLIQGKPASFGYASGPVWMYDSHCPLSEIKTNGKTMNQTRIDFEKAVNRTVQQIKEIESRVQTMIPEAASMIFSAHLLMLKDQKFMGKMISDIESGSTPVQAVIDVALNYIQLFSQSKSTIIREKVNDVEDLANRLIQNLSGNHKKKDPPTEGKIIVAQNLYPSDVVKLACEKALGVVLVGGGLTTHVSILCRSLNLPLTIVDDPELLNLPNGTSILMDADVGNVYIRPKKDVILQFEKKDRMKTYADRLHKTVKSKTVTLDNVQVHLLANINLLSEVETARKLKAEGIGLYRSEFPFLIRSFFPSEEEQVEIYKKMMYKMVDQPITIRTLDIGGEKVNAYYDHIVEPNPELGLRSIRFTLRHPEVLEMQLRAILRAGAYLKDLRIMFPLISSIDEFDKVRSILKNCQKELDDKGDPFHKSPKIGLMVELPAVVEMIDDFAHRVDFFSIGTNDFIQYTLGVDRGNDWVSSYYCPHHPAVLRGIAKVAEGAKRANKMVSVCGEMAHDIKYLPFLLGVGIRHLSIDPQKILETQQTIQHLSIPDCEAFAQNVLHETSIEVNGHHFRKFEKQLRQTL